MLIAFCLFKYFPYGGLQRDALAIVRRVTARGHQARVYVSSWQGNRPEGLEIVEVPCRTLTNHESDGKYADWVADHLSRNPVDRVVGFNKLPNLDFYYQADTCFAFKAFEQRGWLYQLSPRCQHYLEFERATFQRGGKTVLLMISERQIPIFKKYYDTEDGRFRLLPPGISRDRHYSAFAGWDRTAIRRKNGVAQDDFLLLQVGSDFSRKGVDRSVRAVAALPAALRQKTRLFVVGQDDPRAMRRLASQLGLSSQIQFFQGRNDIPELLFAADALLHPAYSENTGTVILEAAAGGLPSIVTDVCGYAGQVRRGNCGIVLGEPFRQQEFDSALSRILSDAPFRKGLARNARTVADTQDIYSMPDRAADIILG